MRLLLQDQRVMVNEPGNDGATPLQRDASYCHHDVIKLWIASGREMNFGKPGDYLTDAIGAAKNKGFYEDEARKKRKTKVVTLLERFKGDAAKTRHAMRVELGWYDPAAAEMFALVVFVSDGLLQIKDTAPSPAARYFKIATQLPLELQMVLCFRQVGSCKEIIPGKESEVAFKELAKILVWSSIFTD